LLLATPDLAGGQGLHYATRHQQEGNQTMTNPKTAKIAELNDLCRKAMGITGRLLQTEGINALPPEDQSRIREKVEMFDAFTADNNPHGERDFGSIEHNGEKVFWKIDYYDRSLQYGSEDPSSPKLTARVLTIMLASEY
jgi:hypothetical protein